MKKRKMHDLYQMIGQVIDTAIDLGAAQQRHRDAAAEEHEAAQEVAQLVQAIETLTKGGPKDRNTDKDLN